MGNITLMVCILVLVYLCVNYFLTKKTAKANAKIEYNKQCEKRLSVAIRSMMRSDAELSLIIALAEDELRIHKIKTCKENR